MNTIIINGSPKVNPQNSNTQLFAEEFIKYMKNPCEIRRIADSDYNELAQYIRSFDTIIFIMPLYVHAMPGIVKKFIEKLEPADDEKKSIGFIIQAGFPETAQEKYIIPYLEMLAKNLNYNYIGTACKGECAGIREVPKIFKKTLQMVNRLGIEYEETNAFDNDIVAEMAKPYELSRSQIKVFNFASKLGLTNYFWHKKLKANNAMDKRLDKPFLY